jgi:hypothetical protein
MKDLLFFIGELHGACLPVGRDSESGGHACAPKRYSAQAGRPLEGPD